MLKKFLAASAIATGMAGLLVGGNVFAAPVSTAHPYTSGQNISVSGDINVCITKTGDYTGDAIIADIRGVSYEKQIVFTDASCVAVDDIPSDTNLKYVTPMGMSGLKYTNESGAVIELLLDNATIINKYLKISGSMAQRVDAQIIETNLQTGKNVNQAIKRLMGVGSETHTSSSTVKNIQFVDTLPATIDPETTPKVNIAADGEIPVYAYADSENKTVYIHSKANKIYANSDSSYMFYSFDGMYSGTLTLTSAFNTSKVTNMSYMFGRASAQNLVLPESFDTSNVTNMTGMFYYYTGMRTLSLPSTFNTSKVTDMNHMFYYTSSLQSLELPATFNTSRVADMSDMFHGASSLTTLTLPEAFSPSSATNMSNMFHYMSSLTTLNLPSTFSTASATDMNNMFSGMSSLTSLVLPEAFNPSKVTNMSEMFSSMYSVTELVLPETFDTSKAVNMSYMFSSVNSLGGLKLPEAFSTASATNISGMFSGARVLDTLVLPDSFAITSSMNKSYIFSNVPTTAMLCSIDYTARSLWPGWIGCTAELKDGNSVHSAFASLDGNGGRSIASLQFVRTLPDTINPETSAKVNIAKDGEEPVYAYIDSDKNVYIYTEAKLIVANKSSQSMFYDLDSITSLELPNYFDTSKVANMEYMLGNMSSIKSIVLPEAFNTQNVDFMECLFYKNPELLSLTLSDNFVVGPFTSTVSIFDYIRSDAVLHSSDATLRSLWPGVLGN